MNQEDIERNIAFIVDQQAKFFADIEAMKEHGKLTDERIDRIGRRLDRAVRLGVQAVRQERDKRRELEETLTGKMNALIATQMRTEESLAAFQGQVGDALTQMAQAITVTNQRIDDLERT